MKSAGSVSDTKKWWILSIGWIVFVTGVSLWPDFRFKGPELFNFGDKLAHFFVYGVMAYLTSFSLRRSYPELSRWRLMLIAILWGGLHGLVIEIIQPTIGREYSMYDELANICGALDGGWLCTAGYFRRLWKK